MKKKFIFILLLLYSFSLFSQDTQNFFDESAEEKAERMTWWEEARFGMFIHWGLYAIPAGQWGIRKYRGTAEWLQYRHGIAPDIYQELAKEWNPQNYNPKRWVELAKNAGMKYIVLTSRHHEGFSLWPTAYSDFSVVNTPYGKDLIQPLADECKKAGIKLCFYYTVLDWHHPDYLPRHYYDRRPKQGADFDRFRQFMKNQLTELIENYDPAVLWFDGEWDYTWTHEYAVDLYNHIKSLNPSIIINNRIDVGRQGYAGFDKEGDFCGDFGTPEQEIPRGGLKGVYWETCMTMNGSWGYSTVDKAWKSTRELISQLVDSASKGGNYLLNVGPDADGVIQEESVVRLEGIAEWMKTNSQAIYGTKAYFSKLPSNARITEKDNNYYIALLKKKRSIVEFDIKEGEKIAAISTLGDWAELTYSETDSKVTVFLPKNLDYNSIPVIKVQVAK